MSVAAPPRTFLETLARSSLFSAQQQEDLLGLIRAAGLHPADHAGIATWCVRERYLTKFQAEQLLRGKWRNHVINRKYKVLEPLGQGGMGAVFRVEHLSLGKEVALKILPREMTRDTVALQRFLREARALAALDHPNIVGAHDVDEVNGQHFIVMACVEGETLLDLVRRDGPLPAAMAAACVVQTCRGLQHAHEAGWVHRDLKPGNLILDRDGTVKIMDFGLARLATPDDGGITRHQDAPTLLGSPDYISPEQAMNNPDIDIRADIYSLGATLYFLLTGHAPFEGEPLMQKLLAHQMREPEEVSFFRDDIPPGLIQALKKMMAKQSADRYATPREVEQTLEPFLRDTASGPKTGKGKRPRGGKARRVPALDPASRNTPLADPLSGTVPDVASSVDTSDIPLAPQTESEPPPEGLSPTAKRNLTIVGAAGVLLAAVILLLLWWTTPPDHETLLANADNYGKQGNWKAAAAIYGDLLRDTPANSKERKELYGRIKAWREIAALLREKFPQDIELCRLAVAHYLKQNEYDQALACLEAVLAVDPNQPDLWHELAGLAVLQRQWPRAIQALEKAYQGKLDNAEWCRDRAFIYVAMGDAAGYERVCREAWQRFGGPVAPKGGPIEVVYMFSQGTTPGPLLEEVLRQGKDLLEEYPNQGNAWFRYAALLYRAGKWQEALTAAQKAQETELDGTYKHRCEPLLAMIQYRLGRKEEARRLLADHRRWRDTAASLKQTKTPFIPLLFNWWDSLALENLTREAEQMIEGKSSS